MYTPQQFKECSHENQQLTVCQQWFWVGTPCT